MCYARYLLLVIVITLAMGQMLAACGQKGPLYMPQESGESEEAE